MVCSASAPQCSSATPLRVQPQSQGVTVLCVGGGPGSCSRLAQPWRPAGGEAFAFGPVKLHIPSSSQRHVQVCPAQSSMQCLPFWPTSTAPICRCLVHGRTSTLAHGWLQQIGRTPPRFRGCGVHHVLSLVLRLPDKCLCLGSCTKSSLRLLAAAATRWAWRVSCSRPRLRHKLQYWPMP